VVPSPELDELSQKYARAFFDNFRQKLFVLEHEEVVTCHMENGS
jgi:hypothetical protein